jgi:hypothetical protein
MPTQGCAVDRVRACSRLADAPTELLRYVEQGRVGKKGAPACREGGGPLGNLDWVS